ncbi:hypothetical protein SDC9_187333 [bioreactor metagenome]|uniref:Uncharacterized protein n=1 Tax=bioreactor metagenome TaxID=1076179 RepID=A0A645HLC3_9ZZZZ
MPHIIFPVDFDRLVTAVGVHTENLLKTVVQRRADKPAQSVFFRHGHPERGQRVPYAVKDSAAGIGNGAGKVEEDGIVSSIHSGLLSDNNGNRIPYGGRVFNAGQF